MAAKRMDLNRNCFFVLSGGLANPLGKHLALEMCHRFREQSLALLIDTNEELLQGLKKDIEQLNAKLSVVTCVLPSWQQVDRKYFAAVLDNVLSGTNSSFDLAVIAHNEGTLATRDLMEPQDVPSEWLDYVHEHLYAPVALNQQFLNQPELQKAKKLVLNITSTFLVQPMYFNGLHGSCKRARDMYFRAMAAEESRAKQLAVLSYAPGLLDSHVPQTDANNNVINLLDLQVDEKLLKLPRVQPLQSILKLINILEEISFISGHDVDYYDTFVL